jgi:hypothetical protein
MGRIDVDRLWCHNCKRRLNGSAVFVPLEEGPERCTHIIARPHCQVCKSFADMPTHVALVCSICGFKAYMPDWLARRQGGSDWLCSRKCYARRKRKDNHWKQRTCEACGEVFTASRKDARACSAKCRQLLYRRRRALTREAEAMADHRTADHP